MEFWETTLAVAFGVLSARIVEKLAIMILGFVADLE
jgi:hypothetical protein